MRDIDDAVSAAEISRSYKLYFGSQPIFDSNSFDSTYFPEMYDFVFPDEAGFRAIRIHRSDFLKTIKMIKRSATFWTDAEKEEIENELRMRMKHG